MADLKKDIEAALKAFEAAEKNLETLKSITKIATDYYLFVFNISDGKNKGIEIEEIKTAQKNLSTAQDAYLLALGDSRMAYEEYHRLLIVRSTLDTVAQQLSKLECSIIDDPEDPDEDEDEEDRRRTIIYTDTQAYRNILTGIIDDNNIHIE